VSLGHFYDRNPMEHLVMFLILLWKQNPCFTANSLAIFHQHNPSNLSNRLQGGSSYILKLRNQKTSQACRMSALCGQWKWCAHERSQVRIVFDIF
jgi:hypothetical protein